MSIENYLRKKPKYLGGFCMVLGAGVILAILYIDRVAGADSRSWQRYSVGHVSVSAEENRKGLIKVYYHFETDRDADVKTGSRNAQLFYADGISALSFPRELELYSTHVIKTPPSGASIIWVEGVKDDQGNIYLDPVAVAELRREDLKIGYLLGAISFLAGLLVIMFIRPKPA